MSIGRIIGLAFIAALLVLVVTRSLQGQMGYALYEIKNVAADRQKVDVTRFQLEERLADMQVRINEIEAAELPAAEQDAAIKEIQAQIADLTLRQTAFSLPRTIGLWIGAFGTIAILSFLWRDNPLYRVAEHLFVGCSAAYIMVVTFYDSYILHGVQTLFPRLIKNVFSPDLDLDPIVERLALRSWLSSLINYEDAVGRALAASWYQLAARARPTASS